MPVAQRWIQLADGRDQYALVWGPKGTQEPERSVVILADAGFLDWEDLNDRIAVFNNVVSYAIKNEEERPASLGVLLACPAYASRESSTQVEAIRVLQELQPDAVIVAGVKCARGLFGADYTKNFGFLKHTKFSATDVHGVELSYTCDACFSVWVEGWTDPDPPIKGDEGGGLVNLLGFFVKHLQNAIRGYNRAAIQVPAVQDLQIATIDTLDKFDVFFERLCATATPSIDLETDNLNKLANKILTFHCLLPDSNGDYRLYFLPWAHRETPWMPDELAYIIEKFRWYFEFGKSRYIIMHGGKFDITQFKNQLQLRWFNHMVYDTQAGEFQLDENRKFMVLLGFKKPDGPYALATFEAEYGYVRPAELMDKSERGSMADKPLSIIGPYGTVDVVTPYLMHLCQRDEAQRRGYDNYLRLVTDQLSKTIIVMAGMEARGIPADAGYLQEMTMPGSPVNKVIDEALTKMREFPSVQALNDTLIADRPLPKKGWDGKPLQKLWLLELNKPAVQDQLFFHQLGLAPLSYTKKEGLPQVNSPFFAAYKNVPEVATFAEWKKMATVKQGFIDNTHERLINDPDCLIDGRIRPRFDYKTVLTGRSSSSDPNSQNQPSQGPLAKIVKRVWIVNLGKIEVKADYRAHEVRGLGNVSNDNTIRKTFALADQAVLGLRTASLPPDLDIATFHATLKRLGDATKDPKALDLDGVCDELRSLGFDELAEAFKFFTLNSDVHILNVKFFFNKVVDKKHVLRYQIKAVVFATIYGQGARSLSIDMTAKGTATTEEEAQALVDKLFEKWNEGGRWIRSTHKEGQTNLVVFNQIGAPRHLWGYLHLSRKMQGAMDRRGPNSLIQGFSGNTAYGASWLTEREVWNTFTSRGLDLGMAQINTVHDSNANEMWFAALPIGLYLIEHGMTTLTMQHYEKFYGTKISVPYGIDMEMGHNERDMIEWTDQRYDSLAAHITKLHEQGMALQKRLLPNGVLPNINESVAAETQGRLLSPGDLNNALHNLDSIAEVRLGELRSGNPHQMTLRGNTKWYEAHCVGL